MADENTQATGGTTEQPEQAAASERTFTQEEVNRLVGEARRKERSKLILPDVCEVKSTKTPIKPKKTAKRLSHATKQCQAMGQEKGRAILSPIRMEGDIESSITTAWRFIDDGTMDVVYWVDVDGNVTEL